MPELIEEPETSGLTHTQYSLLKDKEREWPLIAHDLAMMAVPTSGATSYTAEDIARNYQLSPEQFEALLNLSSFQGLMQSELKRIKELGPTAGVRLRAESMAMAIQEKLFSKVMHNDLDDKLTVQLLGMLLKSAGLEQPPEMAAAGAPQFAATIAFNIPKLPHNKKLAHLMAQSQTNIIDVEPTDEPA